MLPWMTSRFRLHYLFIIVSIYGIQSNEEGIIAFLFFMLLLSVLFMSHFLKFISPMVFLWAPTA